MKLEQRIKLAQMDPELVANESGNFIVGRVLKIGATGGVLGLSGGVDSTAVAVSAKRGFDKYNKTHDEKLELVGYILPSNVNKPEDKEDGIKVAEKLGIRYEVQSIEPIVKAYKATNPKVFENNYDKGNLMSRIRANILSTKAATERKTVIGTGNKDEDFGIGYYTLFGDGAVHISPLGALPKRLVKDLATYFGFKEIAMKTPTAGLEPGQTDVGDLGYNYDAVELVIEGLEQGFTKKQLPKHKQIKENIKPQLTDSKFNTVEEVVEDILKRHYTSALPKAELIHPPVPELTLRYK